MTMTQCLRSHRGYVVACVSRNRVQSVVQARLSSRDAENGYEIFANARARQERFSAREREMNVSVDTFTNC